LHTPEYEAPVRGDPDDLLMIAGSGFDSADRVIYQAMDARRSLDGSVPATNTTEAGTVPIVQRDNPKYALTVKLPSQMRKGRPYRLWVVTAGNEWSTPVAINDPRPEWITPAFIYSSADLAHLGRVLRIVGQNLAGADGHALEIRLDGARERAYILTVPPAATPDAQAVQNHVATALLPARIVPGLYSVSIRGKGLDWVALRDQKLEVRPDPRDPPTFSIDDPAYGGCHADDAADDSGCLARALEAAGRAGSGVVRIPPGHWDVMTAGQAGTNGFLIPPQVQLRGAGPDSSFLARHGAQRPGGDPLLTATSHNSVTGLTFTDDWRFRALAQSRQVIQLGPLPVGDESRAVTSHLVEEIIITDNRFIHIGRAVTDDGGRPLARIFITANVFGAYSDAIGFPGSPAVVWEPFRIDDTVVRNNRFIPGSYLDLTAKQGVLASGMGAARRVDFSANVVDGSSSENLQESDDPPGFRAALFWNMNNSVERLLVAENQIACSGDKVGDGEAISIDGSGGTQGFEETTAVAAAGSDWITVRGRLNAEQRGRKAPEGYYRNGHWVQIVAGPGSGQTRRIVSYTEDPTHSTVTFRIAPAWDVVPSSRDGRSVVQRQFWEVAIVGNSVEHRSPPCRKSNMSAPTGGLIGIWAPSADVTIEANRQWDTDGIQFAQGHSARTPTCPTCSNNTTIQTALEIRGNFIDGEYDWSSDCSNGGIRGQMGASPTPESPPPVVGYGISISHNTIIHADGYRGGGINIPLTSYPGPPPGNWPFIQNLLIFHNTLGDFEGTPPAGKCNRAQRERSGIRLEGNENIRYSVLYGNQCERVARPLADSGLGTLKICSGDPPGSCECPAR
jgi:hypothetical protein